MRVVRWTRLALALSCLAGLGLAWRMYAISPERVPVHYDLTGTPDRWGSPLELFVVHACVIGLGTLLFLALPTLIRRAPKSMINLPNKEYWLSPEHRDAAADKAACWAHTLGTAVNLLMITLVVLLAPNEQGAAAPAPVLSLLMVGFVLFTLCSCVWLARSYELPVRGK